MLTWPNHIDFHFFDTTKWPAPSTRVLARLVAAGCSPKQAPTPWVKSVRKLQRMWMTRMTQIRQIAFRSLSSHSLLFPVQAEPFQPRHSHNQVNTTNTWSLLARVLLL